MIRRALRSVFGSGNARRAAKPDDAADRSLPDPVERFRFRVNQRLKIYLSDTPGAAGHTCLVQDIGEDVFFVSMPMAKGEYVLVHKNDRIHCILYDATGMYHFTTKVVGRISLRLPMLCLEKPAQVQRFQQREFPRARAYLNTLYRIVPARRAFAQPAGESAEAYTFDISSGGVCLVSDRQLAVGVDLSMHIEVPGAAAAVKAVGRIRRVQKESLVDRYLVGLVFNDIQPQERAVIAEYVRLSVGGGNGS